MRISALSLCRPACLFFLAFRRGLSAHCNKQVSAPFRYHLRNSLFAAVAILTGPSASFALSPSLSACLSVSRACLSVEIGDDSKQNKVQ